MDNIAYFLDFEFKTENSTFRPRPETELLTEKAIEVLRTGKKICFQPRILDIGTGCGNIAISLTKYISSSRIVALDISDTALRVARKNAVSHGVEKRIDFIKSKFFDSIKEEHYRNFFDLIVSNPPYVSRRDFQALPEEVKDDPCVALYGGRDGLDFYRKIVKEAPVFLKKYGFLVMEIGYDQTESVKNLLEGSGFFENVEVYMDYSSIERIVQAQRK